MKDLVPLKLLDDDGLGASVLRSADDDEAPPHAMRKVAAALGVQAAVLALSGTATATAAATSTAGAAGFAGVAKALLVGLGAGALVTGSLVIAERVKSDEAQSPAPALSAPAPVRSVPTRDLRHDAPQPVSVASAQPSPTVVPPRRAGAVATAPVTEPPPPAELATSAAPQPTTPAASPQPQAASIAEEVAELDRARALIATKQPLGALRVLDGYAGRWPRGVLAVEAAVLRVEAELARGNRAEAERRARALIATRPNTGYARKVAKLVGIEQEE